MGIFLRWLGAFLLLVATFNPTEWNYVRWSMAHGDDQLPLTLFLGLILLAGFLIYLLATLRSIGPFGMLFVAALFGSGVWVLYSWGLLSLENATLNTWLGLLALSLILGVGLSWSILKRRLSGQATVDDGDE
jgi:Family of unknown function (DUF6524)